MSLPEVRVIADDLTGALEVLSEFSAAGWTTELQNGPTRPSLAQVVAMSTRSRLAHTTADFAKSVGARYGTSRRTFIKVDSAGRGIDPTMIQSLQRFVEGRTLVLCPALPRAGRTIEDAEIRIDGVPVHQTDLSQDGGRSARSSLLTELLDDARAVTRDALTALDLPERLSRAGPVVICDAVDTEDLHRLAVAVTELGDRVVPVGSSGLARALASAWHDPARSEVIVLVSSTHAQSRLQVDLLRGAGAHVVSPPLDELLSDRWDRSLDAIAGMTEPLAVAVVAPREAASAQQGPLISRRLANLAADAIRVRGARGVVVSGGEGAQDLIDALAVERLLPASCSNNGTFVASGGPFHGLHITTKPGSAGSPHALVAMTEALSTRSNT